MVAIHPQVGKLIVLITAEKVPIFPYKNL